MIDGKYTDSDVIQKPELMREAIEWAKARYDSGDNNDFLRSVVEWGRSRGRISVGQARGLLNYRHAVEQRKLADLSKPIDGLDITVLPVGRFHYAVKNDDGGISFYVIDNIAKDDPSRWAGWAFVSQHVGPEEEKRGAHRPGVGYKGSHANLLARIVVDPKSAMMLYGLEIGKCGHCNRRLTNEESRRVGMGPICRGHFGW